MTALAMAIGGTLLPLLAPRPFFSPDEAFYAQVAREMGETGDYVVPRFDGEPWLEKPPLLAWVLSGAFGLLGWGFPAAAAVNVLATLATAGVVAAHASRTSGPAAAFFAFCAYLTMLGPPTAAGTALTDPVLTLCTTAAVAVCSTRRRGAAILCGALLGLGVLTKGPVAPLVVLPAVVAGGLPSLRRCVRQALVVISVAVTVAAPWLVLLASRGLWSEFGSVFLGQHVLQRAMAAERQGGPLWYYVPVLWLVAFPWGTQALLSLAQWRHWLTRSEVATLALGLLGFSLAATKLPHYLLPLLPWIAVALGRLAAAQWSGSSPGAPIVATRLGGIAAGLVIGLLPYWGPEPPLAGLVPEALRPLLLLTAATCPILGFLQGRRWLRLTWLVWAAVALLLRIVLLFVSVPTANGMLVEEPVARIARDASRSARLLVAHRYFRPYLVAYGVRGWRVTASPLELAATLEAASAGDSTLALTSDLYEGELRAAAARGHVLEELGRVRGLGVLGGPLQEVALFRIQKGSDPGSWFTDFRSLGPADRGFGVREKLPKTDPYRWTVQPVAELAVPAQPARSATLRLRCWGPSFGSPPQTLDVRLNGRSLGKATLPTRSSTLSFTVPLSALRAAPQHLELEVSPLVYPAFWDASSKDARALGVALEWLSLGVGSPRIDLLR
ncbi:MAG TPA: glycosyltransferase family 39 protein [Vicinamibacteria bacterium]|nr:glycosyltransferase family 39 protein [Vicinamibacteria bacterium]